MMYATAINWATMTFPFVDAINIEIRLTDNINILTDGLGPVDLVFFTSLLELVIWNLNFKKGHMEYWGNISAVLNHI